LLTAESLAPVGVSGRPPYLGGMSPTRKPAAPTKVVREWPLSSAATLGSSVRARGILLEARARLPFAARKLLDVEAGRLLLRIAEDSNEDVGWIAAAVDKSLEGIEAMPVIPREVEDILSISSAERHRWLKDGRLQSAGTRTVKLRGRARQITFHVFDPRHVEDLLDRDLPELWRAEDKQAAAENRKRAAGKAAMARAAKRKGASADTNPEAEDLEGWGVFESMGMLR
jgi:hypothetical protein